MRFIVVALMLLPTAALAEQRQTFRDANGREIGRSVTNNMGNTTFFDNMGRRVGTKESKQ